MGFISLVAGLSLCACVADHARDVAFRTLFTNDGTVDASVFAAALSAKFPPGSSTASLETYVASNGGTCSIRANGHLWCEFAIRTRACAASMLGIDAKLNSGVTESLTVKAGGTSC
jgi:hypothetical protein